jgi:iron complex outermembrane receptor protein
VEQGAVGVRYGAGTDALAYRIWGKGFTRGPGFHADGRNFDDWRRGQFGFRMDWDLNARDNLMVSGGAYTMEAGAKLGISTYAPPALVNVEGNANMWGQHVTTAWRRELQSNSDIQVRAYFDRTDRDDLNYREKRHTFDVDFIHHLSRGTHDFIWGAGARISPSEFFQKVPTVEFMPAKHTYSVFSGFIQDTFSFSSRLSTTIGTKFEHNSFNKFEIQPSIRVSWTPAEEQTVWGSITRAVRTNSRLEEGFRFTALAVPSLPLYVRLIGDSQFHAEQLLGYELGYRRYLKDHGFIGVSAFYNRYDGLLSVENRPAAPEDTPAPTHLVLPLFFRNGIDARTSGFEISALWDFKTWWRMKGSYSHMHLNALRDPNSNDASTVRQLEGDSPRHKVVTQASLTLPDLFEVDLTYRYVSSIPDQKVPSYSTGDVRIARRLAREWELSAVGQNLFQPHHPEYGGPPGGLVEIRRSAYLKLSWSR